jgi:hypothetical protein
MLRGGFAALGLLSITALLVVALTIFSHKKLSEHPSPLIARICIVEAILTWNQYFRFLDPSLFICNFELWKLFNYSTFGFISIVDSFLILSWSNEMFVHIFEYIALFLNLLLCLDLVKTLWNPFEVTKRRMNGYISISVILSLILVCFIWFNEVETKFKNDEFYNKNSHNQVGKMISALLLSAYIIVGLYSMIFSIRRLNRPGVSPEIR